MKRNNNHFRNVISSILILLIIIGCSLLFTTCAKSKVYTIGVLSGLDYMASCVDGLKEKMTELGYTEGENLTYNIMKTDFDMTEYEKIAKKFVEDKVDILFSFPTEASLVAKAAAAGTNVPVVFNVAFIEGVDLVDSIQAPGGNITGVRYPGPDVALKRLEILLEIAPDVKVIWMPYLKDYPSIAAQVQKLVDYGNPKGLKFIEAPAAAPPDITASLEKYGDSIDAVLTLAEPVSVTEPFFVIFAKYANENNILIGGALYSVGEYGSIFGVNMDAEYSGEQAAVLIDKILKGANAGTVPVVSAENYIEFNYTLAKKLGFEIPEGLLNLADKVY